QSASNTFSISCISAGSLVMIPKSRVVPKNAGSKLSVMMIATDPSAVSVFWWVRTKAGEPGIVVDDPYRDAPLLRCGQSGNDLGVIELVDGERDGLLCAGNRFEDQRTA